MDYLIRQADRLSEMVVWVAGAALVALSLIVGVDVIARWLFNTSIAGTDEIGGYALAITSSWAFAYALFRRAHIRIDSLSRLLPRRLRAAFDVVGLAALGAFMTLMAMRAWNVLVLSVEFNAKSMTPMKTSLWIPQSLWVLGLFFFVAVILLLLAKSVSALVKGEIETVNRLIGTRSLDEEVADEMAGEPGGIARPPETGAKDP